jgi:protein O-GlcNAc transferase
MTSMPGHQRTSSRAASQSAEITSLLRQAVAFHQAGSFSEAEQLYRKVLQISPRNFDAVHLLGVIYLQRGERPEAVRQIDLALKINPKSAAAHNNRANALKEMGQLDEALESYNQAIRLKPDYFEALSNRGDTLNELKRFDQALASCDAAVRVRPDYADAFNNRGVALLGMRRFDEALACYDRAIALRPDYAEAFSNRADVFNKMNRPHDAMTNCESAIRLKPNFAVSYNNRGVAFNNLKRLDEAVESFRQAIALKPDYADAFNNRGKVFGQMGRLEEALACYETATALKPNLNYLMGDLLHTKMQLCDWRHFEGHSSQLISALAEGHAASVPLPLLAISAGPADQLKCAAQYVAQECLASPVTLWRGERYGHDRIRVAYVSSDLREHPVAMLMAGVFEQHDKSRFETIAISLGGSPQDRMSERLKAAFDRFVDAREQSDHEIAALLRDLEVDIAVDLNGFTGDGRLSIFAERPAPVQVNYLGYAGTLGRNCWDYILADRFVIPDGAQGDYAEQVVHLPGSFMATDDGRKISAQVPSRRDAGLPEDGFVFCCFNNSYKITPDVFDVWMRLLKAIEGSVLWLSVSQASAIENLRAEASRRGISGERLVFAARVKSNEDHLARLKLADLFLDTLYYNAHTTACDALWAGLPILTCPGQTFASRVAGSLLSAAGLPELITRSLEEYEALALTLAREPARLKSIKEKLTAQRETCALFDTARFTRQIEAAYTTMWQRAQQGGKPQSFAVGPVA